MAELNMESALRSLLLKAWTDRWSAAKFSVHCRKFVHDELSCNMLTDILMKESVVGSSINQLILSYLQQMVSSQEIPFRCVLVAVSQFDDSRKPTILLQLTSFLKSNSSLYFYNINKTAISDHCELIAGHLCWLVSITYKIMVLVSEGDKSDHTLLLQVVSAVCDIITCVITSNSSHMLLMRLNKHFSPLDNFQRLQDSSQSLKSLLPYLRDRRPDLVQRLHQVISVCESFEDTSLSDGDENLPRCLLTSPSVVLASLTTIRVLGHATESPKVLVKYLQHYHGLLNVEGLELVCEVLRACMSGLGESTEDDLIYWLSFTYAKLPTVLSILSTCKGARVTNADIATAVERLLTYTALLDSTELRLNEPETLPLLLKELRQNNLLPASASVEAAVSESRGRYGRSFADGGAVMYTPGASKVKRCMSLYSYLDTALASFSRVSNGADLVPCGNLMVEILSKLTESCDELREYLICAASSSNKLPKLLTSLIRLNELSVQASHNEVAVEIFTLTTIILTQAVNTFSHQVMAEILPSNYQTTVFVSYYLNTFRSTSVSADGPAMSADSLDVILSKIISKEPIRGTVKFSSLVTCIPNVFVELAKAWHLSAVEESTILEVINEVAELSHSLLLYTTAALIKNAKLSSQQLRDKYVSVILKVTTINTSVPHRDKILCTMINQMLDKHGLSKSAIEERLALTCTEPVTVRLAKSIEEVMRRGFVSSTCYRSLANSMRLADNKWLSQQMIGLMFKCAYMEDTSKAVSLLHVVSLLNLPGLVATFSDSVTSLLHKTTKPTSLAEPRCQAATQLLVWNLAVYTLINESGEADLHQSMGHVFELMRDMNTTAENYMGTYCHQAFYITNAIIHNAMALGPPLSSILLGNMPIELICVLLPEQKSLLSIVLSRTDLTPADINSISASILNRRNRFHPMSEAA